MRRPTLRLEALEDRAVPAAIGALDGSFGGGGQLGVAIDGGGDDRDNANGIAVQADGKIVLVGRARSAAGDFDFAVVRLLPDGSRDESVGPNGVRAFGFDSGNEEEARAVAVQPDGKIVVAGSVRAAANSYDFGIARLNADGTGDATFGPNGKRVVSFNFGGQNSDLPRGRAPARRQDRGRRHDRPGRVGQ